MKCEKCHNAEATYESPGNWCDNCWANWWFEGYTPEKRAKAEPFLFVCRAYKNLGQNASDGDIMHHVMQTITRGSANPNHVREAITQYKEFEKDFAK